MEEKTRIIPMQNLLYQGIVYEEAGVFQTSIFSSAYTRAKKMVEMIVEDTRKMRQRKGNSYLYHQMETPNVISFIGRRGTGKTSTMFSFCEALRDYNGTKRFGSPNKFTFHRDANMEDVRFFVLDSIDASTLEESENVFTLVLANMLNQFFGKEEQSSDKIDYYMNRTMLQKFEEIYNDFITLQEFREIREYSAYEKLKNIASSQGIRKKFTKLVEEYLNYVFESSAESYNLCGMEKYLVVVIDDLDMSHYGDRRDKKYNTNNKAYEIMKNIYKYLSIPGVIVMTAYNHANLYEQCFDFFGRNNQNGNLNRNTPIARQYMEKVFSPVFRLYMPSWRKKDYTDEMLIKIQISSELDCNKEGENCIFSRYVKKGRTEVSIKEFVLILHGEVTGIYYDCLGRKRHFLEPDTLRSLHTIVELLTSSSKSYGKNFYKSTFENQRENILRRVRDDLYFRFVEEKLVLTEERELFQKLMGESIDRRSQTIVSILSRETLPLGRKAKTKLEHYEEEQRKILESVEEKDIDLEFRLSLEDLVGKLRDNSGVEYSYAELVHSIYHMTRKNKEYSSELVSSILYSCSISLSQIYNTYQKLKEQIEEESYIRVLRGKHQRGKEEGIESELEQEKQYDEILLELEKNYTILKNVIGESICGRWTEYYFPAIQRYIPAVAPGLKYNLTPVNIGYQEGAVIQYKIKNENLDKIEQNLKEILFLSMLYTDTLEWDESFIEIKEEKGINCFSLYDRSRKHDFELTAFLKYTFLYEEYLSKMEKWVLEAIKRSTTMTLSDKNVLEKRVKESFKKFWEEYYEWDKEYENTMLPFYNLDLTYNLIKRLFQKNEKEISTLKIESREAMGEKFFNAFKEMLKLFEDYLREIDQFYCLEEIGNRKSFEQAFKQCPYRKMVDALSKDEESARKIASQIITCNVDILLQDIEDTKGADE